MIFESFIYSFFVNTLASCEIALTQSRKKVKMLEGILESKLEVIPNSLSVEDFEVSADCDQKRFDMPAAPYPKPLGSRLMLGLVRNHSGLLELSRIANFL